jgi:molybdopterin converting factor small subunit
MKVMIPGPLRSYTGGRSEVEAEGATIGELLGDLDRRYPGIRFRMIDEQNGIRTHIRFFVNYDLMQQLEAPVTPADTLHIICAISGG